MALTWQEVQVEHRCNAQLGGACSQQAQHADHEGVTGQHHALLTGLEQVAVGIAVAAGGFVTQPNLTCCEEQKGDALRYQVVGATAVYHDQMPELIKCLS
jgi:hypothetical protein